MWNLSDLQWWCTNKYIWHYNMNMSSFLNLTWLQKDHKEMYGTGKDIGLFLFHSQGTSYYCNKLLDQIQNAADDLQGIILLYQVPSC